MASDPILESLEEALEEFSAIDDYHSDEGRARAIGRGLEHLIRALIAVHKEDDDGK